MQLFLWSKWLERAQGLAQALLYNTLERVHYRRDPKARYTDDIVFDMTSGDVLVRDLGEPARGEPGAMGHWRAGSFACRLSCPNDLRSLLAKSPKAVIRSVRSMRPAFGRRAVRQLMRFMRERPLTLCIVWRAIVETAVGAPISMAHKACSLALLLLAGCGPHRPPPARLMFEGLPVSGSMADAQRAGFTNCMQTDAISLRCRRRAVMLAGAGPYEAALDLVGGDGNGGFDQLILWQDRDQDAVYKITDALEKRGWQHCNTATDNRGDQIIYTRKGARVRISMDLSYWNKRRLRVIPAWNRIERRC